jgi:diguanylate cyclase (GGDEF)-like protein/PAS domain S-box-containing protein
VSPDGGGPAAHPDDRYATLFRQSVIPQLLVDLDGSVTEVNEAACALLGVAPTTLIGRDFAEEVLGERPSRGLPLLDAVASGDLEETRTVRRAAPVSQLGDWVSVAPLRGPSGEVWELAVVLLDRPRLQEALRTVEESGSGWRALLEDVNDATLITDQDLVADYVSPSFTAELGHRPADVLGTSLVDLVHPAEADRVRTAVRDFLESGTTRMELSFPMASGAGDWSEVDATVVDLLADPDVAGLVVTLRRTVVPEQRTASAPVPAARDRLTGLPSRTVVIERIREAVDDAVLSGARTALMFVDLDRLTAINDAFGQEVGDRALRLVADVLVEILGPTAAVGRYAGDEFAVLFEDVTDTSAVEDLARRVATGLDAELTLPGGVTVRLTACVGLVFGPAPNADVLVSSAEAATSYAQALGRGRVHVLEEALLDRVSDRRTLGAELAGAIAKDQLVVHYQPIVDLRTGQIVSFEALVRWQHPRRGLLGPDAFLPLADALDLQSEVDDWVLSTACSAAADWPPTVTGPVSVAVNVSPARLITPGFAEAVERALRDSGLPATSLALEVTETAVVADEVAAREALEALSALGVELSIDDFGTGYSSILQLRRLPFAKLKIDAAFVRGLPYSSEDLAICTSVVGLADRLGVRSVAEGVEDPAQAATLAELGCQFGQGFYWSPAVPEHAVRGLLAQSAWTERRARRGRTSLR